MVSGKPSSLAGLDSEDSGQDETTSADVSINLAMWVRGRHMDRLDYYITQCDALGFQSV